MKRFLTAIFGLVILASSVWPASLPQQLKTTRMTDATLARNIDDEMATFEQALAAIFGFTLDTNVTESPTSFDNSGRFTKALLRAKAAGPVGWRILDSTSGKEIRIVVNGSNFDLDENTGTEGSPTWTNRGRFPIAANASWLVPGVATASLSITAGSVGRITDGAASGALVMGDGTNANCLEAKSQKINIVTCPPWNAKGDLSTATGTISSGSAALTGGNGFVAGDVGKYFTIAGGGASPITIDSGEAIGNWLAETNATVAAEASVVKVGSGSIKCGVGAAFTTGRACYNSLTTPVSGNAHHVFFWLRSTVATAAGNLSLQFKNSSAVIIKTISAPALTPNVWKQVQSARNEALTDVKTVEILVNTDLGAMDLYLDHVASANPLNTTIAGFISSSSVTLAAVANLDLEGVAAQWGTDDTTAINAALGFAGATVVFPGPAKSYLFTPPINILDNQKIVFQGGSQLFVRAGTVSGLPNTAIIRANGTTGWDTHGLALDGNREFNLSANDGDGLLFLAGAGKARLYNTKIKNAPRCGVELGTSGTATVTDLTFFDLEITNTGSPGVNCGQGLAFVNVADVNIYNPHVASSLAAGIDFEPNAGAPVDSVHDIKIFGGLVELNGGSGVTFYNATDLVTRDVLVIGLRSQHNKNHGFYAAGVASARSIGIKLIGNTAYRNDQHGFFLNDFDNNLADGNYAIENSQGTPNTYDGFYLHRAGLMVANNQAWDNQGSPTQRYGFHEPATGVSNTIAGNVVSGVHATGTFNLLGTSGIRCNVQLDPCVLTPKDIAWWSGTSFLATLRHNNTVSRTYDFPDVAGNIPSLPTTATTETGTGPIVRQTSPTIITPIIADLTNATHNHTSAATGSDLDIPGVANASGLITNGKVTADVCTLDGATPSTCTIVVAYTTGTSYNCGLSAQTNASDGLSKLVRTSNVLVTITGPAASTGVMAAVCAGN